MGTPTEIVLFAGAGGGVLGAVLLSHRVVCYVERDSFRVAVLKQRIADGFIDDAPIWDDITTFDGRPFRGLVDRISAGVPCRPFSTAARGRNNEHELWTETARVIDEIRPKSVLIENVVGIKSFLPVVLGDLKRLGYCVHPPAIVAAASVGAGHLRRRVWILAHSNIDSEPNMQIDAEMARVQALRPCVWWNDPPRGVRVDDGVANRVDRLEAIGDGQVPVVACIASRLLEDLGTIAL